MPRINKHKTQTHNEAAIPHHGENIKYYRNRKNYSQEYVASVLNENQQTISEWERKEVLPDDILSRVGKVLDIGISWFKEVPLDKSSLYSQDGNNNTNFQKNHKVEYIVHNPLQSVENAYKETNQIISQVYNDSKSVYEKELSILRKELAGYRESFIELISKMKDKA